MKTVALSAALYAALSVAAPVPAAAAGDCKSFVLLFARGTTEMGTMGSVVGPSLSTKVKAALGENNVNVEGVNYAADAGGIMTESTGTGGAGTTAMTNQANSWLTKCPDTKLILTGYSQGAMLVHHTTTKLGSKASKVAAAVTFGDPFKSQKLDGVDPSKFKTFCASGDSVCSMGVGGSGASSGGTSSASTSGHLGYGADTGTAANFIKSAVGSSSTSQLTGTSTTDSSLTPSTGSSLGSGTSSGLGGLGSLIPSSGTGTSSGLGSLGSLTSGSSGLSGFGSNVGASALEARDPQFSGLSSGGLSGGLPSGLPSLGSGTGSGLGGSLPSGLPSGLGSSTGGGLGGLSSGLPSLGSSGTATLDARAPQLSGLGDLGSLSGGGLSGLGSGTGTGSLGGLSTPSFGSLGGSGSGTSPFGSLSSLGSGSLGSGSLGSSGLGSSGLSSGF